MIQNSSAGKSVTFGNAVSEHFSVASGRQLHHVVIKNIILSALIGDNPLMRHADAT